MPNVATPPEPNPWSPPALPRALPGSERRPVPGAVATGRSNPHATIEVTLKVRRRKPLPRPDRPPARPISRDKLAKKYGADPKDVAAVVDAFEKLGLTKVSSDAATRTVVMSGSVGAMEQAFDVKLFHYAHADGAYRGRVGPVMLPAAVKDKVVGVFGLDDRRVAHRKRRHPDQADVARALSKQAPLYLPSDLARRYNFPPGDGAGQTVGILEFGGGYFPDDLAEFCTQAKIPAPPEVTVVSTDGTPTDSHDGAEGEVMLDIEVVAGVCPKAKIVVYFSSFTEQGWITALDAVVQDKANDPGVLSISWGYAEDADIWTVQAMTQVDEALKEAAMLGITVCVAAGDDGSSDAIMDGHAHVDFPASSPMVLAVGGTTIPGKDAPLPDVVWKEGDGLRAQGVGSTGGGVSAMFQRPSWQAGVTIASVNPGGLVGRCVPDLAANADWTASPYLLVVDGQSQPNGGTSAAAPLVASLVALINADRVKAKRDRVGYLTPLLYQARAGAAGTIGQAGCQDVTSGDNDTAKAGGYSAGAGYDAVTGWGTPLGVQLAAALP